MLWSFLHIQNQQCYISLTLLLSSHLLANHSLPEPISHLWLGDFLLQESATVTCLNLQQVPNKGTLFGYECSHWERIHFSANFSHADCTRTLFLGSKTLENDTYPEIIQVWVHLCCPLVFWFCCLRRHLLDHLGLITLNFHICKMGTDHVCISTWSLFSECYLC